MALRVGLEHLRDARQVAGGTEERERLRVDAQFANVLPGASLLTIRALRQNSSSSSISGASGGIAFNRPWACIRLIPSTTIG